MIYDLPTVLEVGGVEYEIRSDYRAVLDILTALADPELRPQDKAMVAACILFQDAESIPPEHLEEAVKRCFWFVDGGDEREQKNAPRLMDWEQDFKHIVGPVNRVLGQEVRAVEYLHWWSFLAAYYEMGDCVFAQIVRVRRLLAQGKPLSKEDREWYSQNRDLVDFKARYTREEDEVLALWGLG